MLRNVIDQERFDRLSSELSNIHALPGGHNLVAGTHATFGFVILIHEQGRILSLTEKNEAPVVVRVQDQLPNVMPRPERRAMSRKRAFRSAFVSGENVPEPSFCMVRDISSAGAMVEFGAGISIPDQFELQLNGKRRSFKAEVRWRNEATLGVRFAA